MFDDPYSNSFGTVFAAAASQFFACSSMSSFFPMVHLALTTAVLDRVA